MANMALVFRSHGNSILSCEAISLGVGGGEGEEGGTYIFIMNKN